MEFMECLNEDTKKKKGHFLYIGGRDVLITTSSNLLDTKYEFMDLMMIYETTLTKQYYCHKAGFCKNKYGLHCYVYRLTVVTFFECLLINSTFLGCDLVLLI